MLIEVRRDLYIDFCQLRLEPIGPGGVEIWGENSSTGWDLGFGEKWDTLNGRNNLMVLGS